METNKLKRFATEARNILMQGVAHRFTALGFQPDGTPVEEPQLLGGGATFMGDIVTEDFYHKWQSLAAAIRRHGLKDVVEEAAYTWFNRLMAIRIMTKNGLIPPVLQYESPGVYVPLIVSEARQGRLPQMNEEERSRLMPLLDDDSRTAEQFSLLIVAFCHATPILQRCFGHIADYTELLLPANILAEGGFVDLINHTDFIAEEDYRSSELIGWLYQFYIAEKKDEVFAAKGKFTASEIPAATQIFTPNWIVKYMVQNTVGRIYLDNNPYETEVAQDWKYLVGGPAFLPDNRSDAETIARQECRTSYDDLTELRLADLACGSGHILGEMFDMLYTLYINEGYSRREAIENIFRRNLTGIDIDTRAKQLAQFSLLLKACQRDASFADCHCMPRVLDMPQPYPDKEHLPRALADYIMAADNDEAVAELVDAVNLMDEADNLGSIMKFPLSERTRNILAVRTEEYEEVRHSCRAITSDNETDTDSARQECHIVGGPAFLPDNKSDAGTIARQECRTSTSCNADDNCARQECRTSLLPYARIILALTEQYHALVMNPPYMGGGNMNTVLSNYVKKNYEAGKADLFSVFMQVCEERLVDGGKYGMINMQSWMFLSSFEKLRTHLLNTMQIDNMLHLGPRTFDELSGEVVQNTAFVLTKHTPTQTGTYYRLVEGKNCSDKERMFLAGEHCYPHISQQNFKKIPGCPIGYWVSPKIQEVFTSNLALSAVASPCVGLQTADNARFLRLWFEVSQSRIGFGCENAASAARSQKKWFPHNKGGEFRKWYGNQDCIVNWENDGIEIKNFKDAKGKLLSRPQNQSIYFKSAISWSVISSGTKNFRFYPIGFIPNMCGMCCILKTQEEELILLGYSNSKIASLLIDIVNPTMNLSNGVFAKLPSPFDKVSEQNQDKNIIPLVSQNISISKSDWDAHETSWDFEENELVRLSKEVQHSCCASTGASINNNISIGSNETDTDSARQECRTSYFDKRQWVDIKYTHKLPHWRQDGKTQFVTFRLADSLPQSKLHELSQIRDEWLKAHPQPWDEKTKKEYNLLIGERIDKWLDAGYGNCSLKNPNVRRIVTDAFLHFNNERYVLLALVIMPNHVHTLLTPAEGHDVVATIGRIKGFTASRINKMINDSGEFWQRDCFDRIIRNEMDFDAKLDYIINNPANLPQDAYTLIVGGEEVQHSCCASSSYSANYNGENHNGENYNGENYNGENYNGENYNGARQECRTSCRLSDLMEAYKAHWTEQFLRLHANEEELNRQFIGIYGLEDELTPDVPPEEITILQQGKLTFEEKQ